MKSRTPKYPVAGDQPGAAEALRNLVDRLRAGQPGFSPPPFSPQTLIQLLTEPDSSLPGAERYRWLAWLRAGLEQGHPDLESWQALWFLLHYIRRFGDPDRQIDAWGYEPQMLAAAMRVFEFLYNRYWRVSVSGIEQVPSSGRALLISNHSGQLPWDATMIATTLHNHHPAHRLVRTMTGTWFTSLPFLSTVLTRLGQAPAIEDNAVRLLAQEQLLLIFPEGVKGLSKLYEQRYQLARFGRGGFARMALLTGAPLIPVAVVGAEETFISIAKLPWIDELFGYPFLPVTLTWPWLGLLGLVPLPTKWTIDFGDPIPTAGYGPGAAANLLLVSMLSSQVRNAIQGMLFTRLQQRRSVWWG